MMDGENASRRVFFDVTGLLHWYAYFRHPAGVQRMIEKVAGSAPWLTAARATPGSVVFSLRVPGTEGFLRLDPGLVSGLNEERAATIPRLRDVLADSLWQAPLSRLARRGRYYHLPYVARGAWRRWARRWTGAAPADLPPVASPRRGDVFVNPGDLWWQGDYASTMARLRRHSGVRLVQVVHDFHVEERADWSPAGFSSVFARQLRAVAPDVDHWLTPSVAVRGQLEERLRRWNLPARPVTVYPQGIDSFAGKGAADGADPEVLGRHGLAARSYLLFVGTIEPRKNLAGLLNAMELLVARLGSRVPRLVVVGGYGWRSASLRQRIEAAQRRGTVAWLRDIDDRSLAALYRGARFTVMPSLGEGFGLAIQESLAHGVPCIATDGAAMREAGRDLARYVDPREPKALEVAIEDWITDDAALAAVRARIATWLRQPGLPTWDRVGTLILRDVCGG